jgi:uncharacterized protein YwgA
MSIAIVAFIIRELGIRTSTLLSDGDDGIDARVRVQKVAYFLKRLGYDIVFEFDLYYHGPYSGDLAEAIECLAGLGDRHVEELAVLCLRAGDCKGIRSTVEHLSQYPTATLEVASTIRSLLDSPDYRNDLNGAIDHVRFLKPWVNDGVVKDALSLLRSLGLLD